MIAVFYQKELIMKFDECHGSKRAVYKRYRQANLYTIFRDGSEICDFEHLFQVVEEAHGDIVEQILEMYELHPSETARGLLQQMIESMREMPTKKFRNSCAEEDLLEFTLDQAEFVLLMVSITAEKMLIELDNTGLDRGDKDDV
jgi:hypothetical protein